MDSLGSVVNSLKKGEVVAYPTEGVWGLGCDPSDDQAITKLLNLKGRSESKGLILIGSSLEQFSEFIEVEKCIFLHFSHQNNADICVCCLLTLTFRHS